MSIRPISKIDLSSSRIILPYELSGMCTIILHLAGYSSFETPELQNITTLGVILEAGGTVTYEQMQFIVDLYNRLIPEEVFNMSEKSENSDINSILTDREKTHGSFSTHARVTQDIKRVIDSERTNILTDVQREALEMIAHKIGRVVAGNPNEKDHWVDIAGYATLVVRDLEKEKELDYKSKLDLIIKDFDFLVRAKLIDNSRGAYREARILSILNSINSYGDTNLNPVDKEFIDYMYSIWLESSKLGGNINENLVS